MNTEQTAPGDAGRSTDTSNEIDKALLYRTLVKQYENLASSKNRCHEKRQLRKRISDLCWEIARERFPLGVEKSAVIHALGPPISDMGFIILYYGDRSSYFHCFVFEDGRLIDHDHVLTLDLEGGR